MSDLYVFALAEQKVPSFTAAGHRIELVRASGASGVYAAVERNAARPEVSEAALRIQHGVVACIAKRLDAVLPARFGALVDARELDKVVSQRRDAIREALALVRGRDQMTVRLFDRHVRPGPPAPSAAARPETGMDYLRERKRAAAGRPLPELAASIAAAVRDIVAAERIEGGRGRLSATLYHLVDRPAVNAYAAALAAFQAEPGEHEITVSGPWPPFAFAPELWP
jgi:hypothetical protein